MFPQFRETLKEMRTKCEVLVPKFTLKGGRLPAAGEEVVLDLDTARFRERRGQVRIVGEPFVHDTGVRVEDPPPPPWPRSKW